MALLTCGDSEFSKSQEAVKITSAAAQDRPVVQPRPFLAADLDSLKGPEEKTVAQWDSGSATHRCHVGVSCWAEETGDGGSRRGRGTLKLRWVRDVRDSRVP